MILAPGGYVRLCAVTGSQMQVAVSSMALRATLECDLPLATVGNDHTVPNG